MPIFTVEGTRSIRERGEFTAEDGRDAVRLFREFKPGFRPESVTFSGESLEVLAVCEGCGRGILEGDRYVCTEDGVYLCRGCEVESE